jgi:hypothetical protein
MKSATGVDGGVVSTALRTLTGAPGGVTSTRAGSPAARPAEITSCAVFSLYCNAPIAVA